MLFNINSTINEIKVFMQNVSGRNFLGTVGDISVNVMCPVQCPPSLNPDVRQY
jgi:hypothetical protein